MTVEEIFSGLSVHMVRGIMLHEQLASYYDFLGLRGYKRCHEYHYLCESVNYRKLCRYYINHFNKLIPEKDIESVNVIPMSWYRYKRDEVDITTRRNAVKTGVETWVAWETQTKDAYEKAYKDLFDLGEVAAALKIACFLEEVDRELKCAQRKHLHLLSIDFDPVSIEEEQECLHDKYESKIGKSVI